MRELSGEQLAPRALALEGARKNVTVNAIAPGYCDTDLVSAVPPDVLKTIIAGIPVGRLGVPSMSHARQSSSPKARRRLSPARRIRSMEAST
jgi:NAD(P)-dependent dehydrogenase (short-subunit alcohol dehydrogenase family)